MSLATDKLETIREQVQYHLDHAEKKQLTPEQERDLKDQIKARLEAENAVIVAIVCDRGDRYLSSGVFNR